MAVKKRMSHMSLASFGQTTEPEVKPKAKAKVKKPERMATINIQITRTQQRWLQDIAQQIRDNNTDPVAGPDRVYPVHLIQAAIERLRTAEIDWNTVKNIADIDG